MRQREAPNPMLDDSDETTRHDSSDLISISQHFPFILSVFECSWTGRKGTRKGHIQFHHVHLESGRIESTFRAGEGL